MKKIILFISLFIGAFALLNAQPTKKSDNLIKGVSFRNIGPAFMSGRIADVAIHPENHHIWYVAAGSGGVWKTSNSGTTWQPVFDGQKSFSIGCVSIDPNNPHRVWVGTGENVGGRHMGFGDGIYLSEDDGKSWKNMGLKQSEHISEIIVHPSQPNTIFVASQGPLWSKGGQRGFFKSTDGGKTWKKTLGDNVWVGVTDIALDPRNPNRIYAATWERHRTVAAYMGGGKNTAIYRSEDGGETWTKIMSGIAGGKHGKIGLAISPINPDVIYAAVELNRRKGAVYKSTNRGASWQKQSDAVSGATGPHYYQELYASPHEFDKIFLANVRMLVSGNGGKNFHQMSEQFKHSDNHVLKFVKDDPNYMLVGTDGGLYESFDKGASWRFINNLPITQFYKIALDDTQPFYNIYGGTQDNSTQRGPSRTAYNHGIANRDWEVILFADGHQPATEPGNPNIVYAEWQEGHLVRKDMKTGEAVAIQPQAREGEGFERFNWDAPILVSPHNPKCLYFASHRVWKSENRGDDWIPVSGDLTNYEERFNKPIMGKRQSWDSPWDVYAMSTFNTITSLAESPVQEGLLYAGTDDGLLQVSDNGGKNWKKIAVNHLPGVPAHAFVNHIFADNFDAGTVYVCLDNHKQGDYKPYIYRSTDKGKTWKKITGDLPKPLIAWRLVQDYKKPGLLFLASEFGVYYTLDGGTHWTKLNTKANISFRDIKIKKGADDVVAASFGRGIFILDDYAFLRDMDDQTLQKDAVLFQPKDSWWYFSKNIFGNGEKGSQGAGYFTAPNPPYGTTFTYYIKDGYESPKAKRQKKEKQLEKNHQDIDFPGWEALDKEQEAKAPALFISILDDNNEVVNRLKLNNQKGIYRATWDHTRFSKKPISAAHPQANFYLQLRVVPGTYKAYISKQLPDGNIKVLSDTVSFKLKALQKGSLQGKSFKEIAGFWKKADDLNARVSMLQMRFNKMQKQVQAMQKAVSHSDKEAYAAIKKLSQLQRQLQALKKALYGSPSKMEVGEKDTPGIYDRLSALRMAFFNSYGPTGTQLEMIKIAENKLRTLQEKSNKISSGIKSVRQELKILDIPYLVD